MTTREERHKRFHQILADAAVEAMKALDDDLSKVSENGVVNILESLASGMIDAYQVAVCTLLTVPDDGPDLALRFTKRAFSIQMAKRREHADGAQNEEHAARMATDALLSNLPDNASEALVSSAHLYALRQFAFAQMAQTMDARPIRAAVDEGIRNAITFNGKAGKP